MTPIFETVFYKGIFVTTTGFSKDAGHEAERADFAIALIDSDWLVDLLVSYYESLDPEIEALVPLRKIYWPV
ncbi:restriction endonuclease [Chitinophaga filiformis]|uniref:restriction endonuclease n=1 Tax=Chitinophaga filiformis TaxID=104663 RepID=UPI001F19C198|nr:restriction endonuclease [Chitinophaga filiformis]MCF6404813.1 restriction endonuclease [Chitinophaga filiformis]